MLPNRFETQIEKFVGKGLYSLQIDILQVNLGLRCNQECNHCHLEASPRQGKTMTWATMQSILEIASSIDCKLVDLTGGAPELNPNFCRLVASLSEVGHNVQVRTNITVLLIPGMEKLPAFFKEHRVQLVASLPCYLENNVNAQRGAQVYLQSITALQRLNAQGYGLEPGLILNLVYNPEAPQLPPEQARLESDYRRELRERFGINFSHLLTITNMPIGRFRTSLQRRNEESQYLALLRRSFNSQTLKELMCRHQLSIDWDGNLHDCDFNLALGYSLYQAAPSHIQKFDLAALARRRIVTGEHCFGCTAGSGSSCGGTLLA